jgi:Flp pilus assembly protein TadD
MRFAVMSIAAVLGVTAASAQPPPSPSPAPPAPTAGAATLDAIPPCHPPDPAQEHADAAVVQAVLKSLPQDGYGAIEAHAGELQAVLDHTPAGMTALERCGDTLVVRTGLTELLVVTAHYGAALKAQTVVKRVTLETSPAPVASLLLGSLANERKDYPRAYRALQVGLAIDPSDPRLASEASTSLSQLNRFDEALEVVSKPLAGAGLLPPPEHARLLRSRGLALEGLHRWDEAEAAYRQSLDIAPNNPVALNELTYIGRQRRGAPPTPLVTVRSSPPVAPTPQAGAPPPPTSSPPA